jgi:acyl-CoA reductase-like NAD-dependent aldehyde dehydrogenase
MAWTYSDSPASGSGATSAQLRDAVRLAIGDTDSNDPQPVSDAEIAYFLTQTSSNVDAAALLAAEKLAAYYSRQADTSNGKLSVSASQRAAAFRKVAATLRQRSGALAEMFVGGLTKSGKQALDSDTDATQPAFRIGMDDLPDTQYPGDEDTREY